MAKLDLKALIDKLNTPCRKALESAAGLCLSHTHYEVDLEHFLIKLLEIPDTDLQKILRYFEINEAHFVGDLTRALEEFKRIDESHHPQPLPAEALDELDRILIAADKEADRIA